MSTRISIVILSRAMESTPQQIKKLRSVQELFNEARVSIIGGSCSSGMLGVKVKIMCEIVDNRRLRIMLPQGCTPSVYDDQAGLNACFI